MPQFAVDALSFLPQWAQMVTWYGVVALVLFIIVILMMAFLTLAERRVLGVIQARIGPNRVGPWGIGQPFADVIKLILKEIVIPSKSSRFLYLCAAPVPHSGACRLGGGAAVARTSRLRTSMREFCICLR